LLNDSTVGISVNTIINILFVYTYSTIGRFHNPIVTIIDTYIISYNTIILKNRTITAYINPCDAIANTKIIYYLIIMRIITICNSAAHIIITYVISNICIRSFFINSMPKITASRRSNPGDEIANNSIVTTQSIYLPCAYSASASSSHTARYSNIMNIIPYELAIRARIIDASPHSVCAVAAHIKALNGNIITGVIPDLFLSNSSGVI